MENKMKRKEFIKYAALTSFGTFAILNPMTAQANSHGGGNGNGNNGQGWGPGGNPNNNGQGNSIWNNDRQERPSRSSMWNDRGSRQQKRSNSIWK